MSPAQNVHQVEDLAVEVSKAEAVEVPEAVVHPEVGVVVAEAQGGERTS